MIGSGKFWSSAKSADKTRLRRCLQVSAQLTLEIDRFDESDGWANAWVELLDPR